jgi:hypothetical protein
MQCADQMSANDQVRRVVNTELQAQEQDHTHWMYRDQKEERGRTEVRLIVETKDGDLSRLVSINDRPLTEEEQRKEDERIQKLVNNPDEQRKLQRDRDEDGEEARSLLKIMPDASFFTYRQRRGDLVQLDFRPNPDFKPPSREAHVFHEMNGEMWVNTAQNRLAEISGYLMEDVKFGGGLLGHLDKGGWFKVKQAEIAPHHWELTILNVNMNGKVLFFKTIAVQQKEYRSDFRRVADNLTLAEAAGLLRREASSSAKHAALVPMSKMLRRSLLILINIDFLDSRRTAGEPWEHEQGRGGRGSGAEYHE